RKTLLQQRTLWIGMNTILPEAFSERDSGAGSAGASPLLHSDEVIVDLVLLPQPVPLRLMFRKHLLLCFKGCADVDGEVSEHRLPASADEFDRIEVVEVRNGRKRSSHAGSAVVRDGRRETGV